jgi:hypothetical protein
MIKMVTRLKHAIMKRFATRASYTQTIVDLQFELVALKEKHKKAKTTIKKQRILIKRLLKGTQI